MRKSAQRNTNEDNNIFEVEEIINKKIVNGIVIFFCYKKVIRIIILLNGKITLKLKILGNQNKI